MEGKLFWKGFDDIDCGESCGHFIHRTQQEHDLMSIAGILQLSKSTIRFLSKRQKCHLKEVVAML